MNLAPEEHKAHEELRVNEAYQRRIFQMYR